jgi:hypothetical protein
LLARTPLWRPLEYLAFLNVSFLNASNQVTPKDRDGLEPNTCAFLLTFDKLFSAPEVARWFWEWKNGKGDRVGVENVMLILNYIRYCIYPYFFGFHKYIHISYFIDFHILK